MDKRYLNITTSISQDGLGIPVVSLYFSYCDRKEITGNFCKGCQNPHLQVDGEGYLLSFEEIVGFVDNKIKQLNSIFSKDCGIAFVGGDPMAKINRDMVVKLSEYYKDYYQVMYTWRTQEMIDNEWIKYINKTVCGSYIEELNNDNYIFGSTNQIAIDTNKNVIIKYDGGN